ncbi:MAG: CBS domain-containing protein [Anaerolineales bacterium]
MRLILTHEQADFDAIAALYGAYLLDENAHPILPRRINRNARAFLTLYGADFPFLDPRDLPQGAAERVTLVDTQSLITLKGMSERTQVRVFDHHPLRKNNPPNWDVTAFDLGATTTFLVEALDERGLKLTPIQATLLLLGIYEDTGALTFSRTTARDARAAAWLLEQGADLSIAVKFLNPPLTNEQREVYDRLVSAAETHEINGHRLVLTCGEATSLSEEISTLAHKLRDLFDPDALFVLVQTIEGIRLVARSTTDDIDVAAIAAHFGGGGHNRAAAALIKKDTETVSLMTIREKLLSILPAHIRPPLTVAQVMSRRPRLLAPETPVHEAAQMMARYGYEGFPVAQDGKLLGLLTRRAVDRALSHRLNLTAASLMEAGEITVQPGDSLQQVQTLMIESGWGQIPVVAPENGKIIGIVTRTDLLKTLARHPRPASPAYAKKLERGLPPGPLALIRAVAQEAEALRLPAYLVGGFVRDLLLNRPSLDFDIVIEGDAIALAKTLARKHGGRVTSHSRFGTAKWNLEHSSFNIPQSALDLISSRQEFYEHPTALPTVERGSIKLDLHRRDFTINTLALRLDGRHFGELHDYYGGLPDLQKRRIRVLHSLSFIDDPTRMLRAVRYEQRYGFHIEPRTLQLMGEAKPLLARLSEERLRHELDLIVEEPNAPAMLSRLAQLNLMTSISDVLPWSVELRERLDSAQKTPPPPGWRLPPAVAGLSLNGALTWLLWLLDLPPANLEHLHKRLRFPLGLYKALLAASTLKAELPALSGQPASQWVQRLESVPLPALYAVYLVSREPALERYALHWQHIHPKTTGETLKALGLPPGPPYQQLLWQLRAAWLDGELASENDEQAMLKTLL